MSLQKGFLSNQLSWKEFNKVYLWGAVIVWLLLSFSLYSFMYIVREVLRNWTYYNSRETMLVLTEGEHYFYNFFYACLACIIASGIVMDLILKRNLRHLRRAKHKRLLLLNDQSALNAYFLSWFSKLALVYGLIITINNGYTAIDFYDDYVYFFIALLIVLFLHQWLSLRRTFKRQSLQWMSIAIICIGLISFGFSRIDLINYRLFENNLVTHSYWLRLPLASEAEPMEWGRREIKIYLGFKKDSTKDDRPRIIAADGHIELTLEEVADYARDESFDSYEQQIVNLYIDKNVKTKYVKELQEAISKSGQLQWLLYRTDFSSDSRSYGLTHRIRPFCSDFHSIADSLRGQYEINLADLDFNYPCLTLNDLSSLKESVKMRLVRDQLFLNGKPVGGEDLQLDIYTFIKANPKVVIELDIDDDSHYGHYIQLLNTLLKVHYDRRDELVHERFGGSYRKCKGEYCPQYHEIMDFLREAYPMNIAEWSDDEKIVLNYIRTHQEK